MIVAVCAGLVACAPQSTSAPAADQTTAAQQTLDLLASAIRRRDRAAFDQQLSTTDPGFARPASEMYDNLVGLPLVRLEWRVHGTARPLAAGRRSVLPRAWMQAVTVVWQLGSDSGPATHELWWTFEPEAGRALLAGVTDTPHPRAAQPIWLLEPLQVTRVGPVVALESRGSTTRWAEVADRAVVEVRERLPVELARRWNGQVVLEIPNSEDHFRKIVGMPAGPRSRMAAIAFPEGPDPSSAAVRVVVNPGVMSTLPGASVSVVLLHETTHVLTHSADSPAPLWLVEGYADWVAYDVHRSQQLAAESVMAKRVQTSGVPDDLPSNSDFRPTAASIDLTYTQSWLVCRYIAETYSAQDLGELYVRLDRSAELGGALEDVLGLTGEAFREGWRDYLAQLANR